VAASRWMAASRARAAAAVVALAPLAVLTWQASHHYADEESLFRSVVARNPTAWMAHSRLSLIEVEKPTPNLESALVHAREAVRFNPRSAEVHDTLGLLLQHQGKLADARAAFETATRLNPALPGPHVNLGMVAHAEGRLDVALGRLDDSIAACRRALQFPENATLAGVRNNFGITLAMAGRAPEARAEFREALRLDPNLTSARENLARVGGP